jgi:hypothetical protein
MPDNFRSADVKAAPGCIPPTLHLSRQGCAAWIYLTCTIRHTVFAQDTGSFDKAVSVSFSPLAHQVDLSICRHTISALTQHAKDYRQTHRLPGQTTRHRSILIRSLTCPSCWNLLPLTERVLRKASFRHSTSKCGPQHSHHEHANI